MLVRKANVFPTINCLTLLKRVQSTGWGSILGKTKKKQTWAGSQRQGVWNSKFERRKNDKNLIRTRTKGQRTRSSKFVKKSNSILGWNLQDKFRKSKA